MQRTGHRVIVTEKEVVRWLTLEEFCSEVLRKLFFIIQGTNFLASHLIALPPPAITLYK